MPRSKSGTIHKRRVKSVLNKTKGFRGARSKLYRTAKNAMFKSLSYAYSGRKQKKRHFRQLWIARINAVCRNNDISYSRFIYGLDKAGIEINRKTLANLAITDPKAFEQLIETAKKAVA
jgi:large subunit ribosomal protein L20